MDPLFKTALRRTLFFLLWTFLSAWLFSAVEYTQKDDSEEKHQLLLSLYDSMASKYNMTIEEFNNFSNHAHQALSEPKPRWTYPASVNFVFQALTTIGYGYITPQTSAGQILCIFVCLVGIPITLLMLNSTGELIARLVNSIATNVEQKFLKRAQPKQVKTKSAVILFLLMVLLIVVNSLLVTHFEDWTIVEGVYFSFVTLSTIGFGDYVPAKQKQSQGIKQLFVNTSKNHRNETTRINLPILFGVVTPLYAVLALCIVSSVLNSIMAAMEERKCGLPCPGCISGEVRDHVNNEQYTTKERRETKVENEEPLSEIEL
ncbi:potassium channel subfamily K member 9-like [Oculina patagonica]